jgi:ABC-type lipoprotein release transport system permease subunit
MQSVLFSVAVADPLSIAVVGLLVTALAAGATLVPAWRALRQAPLVALREG